MGRVIRLEPSAAAGFIGLRSIEQYVSGAGEEDTRSLFSRSHETDGRAAVGRGGEKGGGSEGMKAGSERRGRKIKARMQGQMTWAGRE